MQKAKIAQSVRTLIVDNKLKEALSELSDYVKGIDRYLEHELFLHTASFNKNQIDFSTDLISRADYATSIARLNSALIQMLDRLPENGNEKTTANATKERAISFDRLAKSTNPEIYAIIDFYKSNLNKGTLDNEVYFNLGLCYLHLKLFDLAKTYFEKALKLSPDNADYHYYLGLAYIRGRRTFYIDAKRY